MLIQFRVENHRSLRDEQTLSLVAANIDAADDACLLRPKGLNEALLPAVALYGANASGKTNVLHALSYMRSAILNSHRRWEPEAGIRLDPFALTTNQNPNSLYEIDLVVSGTRFRYGFVVSSDRVEEEWLHSWPNGKQQIWFEREADEISFGRNFFGEKRIIQNLTRQNSLFLSAGAQNNQPALLPIFRWFQGLRFELDRHRRNSGRFQVSGISRLYRLFDESFALPVSLFPDEDEAFKHDREAIVRLLRMADTGILDLRVEHVDDDDPRGRPGTRANLYFRHKAADPDAAWLPIEAESAGTIALLELAERLVPTLRTGGVLCVDELETSLHPLLAATLLTLFCNQESNPGFSQLIFTTHDTNLLGNILDSSPLRRDQIWFTEKDDLGVTHLYPLTDYHPRKSENLERGYLQGRYGAIPYLGTLVDTVTTEAEY